MESQVAALWRKLKPGGRLVVGVWGVPSLEPVATVFLQELSRLRPVLVTGQPRPWHRLTTPEGLSRLLIDGAAAGPEVHPTPDRQYLGNPDDGWTIVMGTGFRVDVEQLPPSEATHLKERFCKRFVENGVLVVETNGLHAVAWKG